MTAPGCPHCPGVKQSLQRLREEGLIGELEVADAAMDGERARRLNVGSVPWLRLGPFVFEGQMTPNELRQWACWAAQPDGLKTYYFEMLKTGRRAKVEASLREDPQRSAILAELIGDPQASMAVRLGIGAVLEELRGSGVTAPLAPPLAAALAAAGPRDRADIAYFLGLIGGEVAQAALRACLDDSDAEVREIAREALGAN